MSSTLNEGNELNTSATLAPITKTPAALPVQIDGKDIGAYGLKPSDMPEVRALADRININDPLSIAEFGRDVAQHTAAYTDELLDQVRNSDLDEAGKKLSQVVTVARALNLNALTNRRSKLPIVGPWIDKFRLSASNFMAQYETTNTQITTLVQEVDVTQNGLRKRNETLDTMFDAVKVEHRLLGVHVVAAKLRLQELANSAQINREQLNATDVQTIADYDAAISNLEMRAGNMLALQHSALQTLPQIRIIQGNNQTLVDKFHTIREVTVPSWKRSFAIALGLNEQRNAVELSETIDDATNAMLLQNAALLKTNSIETAKANQRFVIDIETLQQVQTQLIETLDAVLKIQSEGVAKRRDAEVKFTQMRADLHLQLNRPVKQLAA